MKRTLSLVLALVMILGSFGTVFAAHTDPADTVAAGAFLDSVGVLEGDDDGNLMLDKTLLRRDMVVLLSRLMGVEETAANFPSAGVLTFEDITDPYYNGYIAWSVSNELIEGHSELVFGFNENVTAQQYLTVLMRALGYKVDDLAYTTILTTAQGLGLWDGLDVENDDQITRGQMAVMTLNALGTSMNGSDETLAEFLGIEMPVPVDLKVENVKSENLREVLVELSNAKLAEVNRLEEANNYRVDGKIAERVTLVGNTLIVELKETLTEGREYELVIRNVDKDVNGKFKFTARDNAVPVVEDVEVLGEYGIKVKLSEPVENPNSRDFLIDGRNVSMNLEEYGRTLILTPSSGSFSANAEKLTVKSLEDYAGFKSSDVDFNIEIVKDEVAPKVTDVVVRGNLVEVTFDKDIYKDSVKKYKNRRDLGNVSYDEGRVGVYAETDAKKVDVNKAEYTFVRELPRNATVTIEGVQNHSKVTMEKTTQDVREVIDYLEPEIIETEVETTNVDRGEVTITLTFNKDVRNSGNVDNYELYDHGEVLRRNELDIADYFVSSEFKTGKEDVVILKLEGLKLNNAAKDFDYVLEVKDFTDKSSIRNRMYPYYLDFEVDEDEIFVVEGVKVQAGSRTETEIVIEFNNKVDKRVADLLENYNFKYKNSTKEEDLRDLKGKVEYEGSKKVVLVLDTDDFEDLELLTISGVLKDEDGNRLGSDVVVNLDTLITSTDEANARRVIALIDKFSDADLVTDEYRAKVKAARKAYDDLNANAKSKVVNYHKIKTAEDKIKEADKTPIVTEDQLDAHIVAAFGAEHKEVVSGEEWIKVEDNVVEDVKAILAKNGVVVYVSNTNKNVNPITFVAKSIEDGSVSTSFEIEIITGHFRLN